MKFYLMFCFFLTEFKLAELSGFLTVGVGDSFASIFGSALGKHKLFGSKKSLEGTVALVFSQLGVFFVLSHYGLVNFDDGNNIIYAGISLMLSGYAEAFTTDNDNLILPLVVYPFLSLIK